MKNKTKDVIFFGLIICIMSTLVSGAILWNYEENIPEEKTTFYESLYLWIICPIVDNDGIIYLVFDCVENALSYDVYRSKDEGDYSCIGNKKPIGNFTLIYKDIVLESGKYDYKLKVVYEIGESDFSNVRRIYVNLEGG